MTWGHVFGFLTMDTMPQNSKTPETTLNSATSKPPATLNLQNPKLVLLKCSSETPRVRQASVVPNQDAPAKLAPSQNPVLVSLPPNAGRSRSMNLGLSSPGPKHGGICTLLKTATTSLGRFRVLGVSKPNTASPDTERTGQ